jgi:chromosome segregation ATPase
MTKGSDRLSVLHTDPTPEVSPSSEVARVGAFLRHVEESARQLQQQLDAAAVTIAGLRHELTAARQLGEQRGRELEETREAYRAELRTREEKAQNLVESFLRERFAKQLDDVRTQVAKTYETRIAQLETTITERDVALAQAQQASAAAYADIERLKVAATADHQQAEKEAAAEIERLRQRHSLERDVCTTQLAETRSLLAAQYEDRMRQLEANAAESGSLLEPAHRMINSLEADMERLRASAADELRHAREAFAVEKKQSEAQFAQLQANRNELAEQVVKLDKIVSAHDDMRGTRAFEDERRQLLSGIEDRDRQIQRMAASLRALHDACTKSPAARSIIAGASGGLNLDALFNLEK